jgi:hypothetical protein
MVTFFTVFSICLHKHQTVHNIFRGGGGATLAVILRKMLCDACYGDSFTFLYVNVVRTSQETSMDLYCLLQE